MGSSYCLLLETSGTVMTSDTCAIPYVPMLRCAQNTCQGGTIRAQHVCSTCRECILAETEVRHKCPLCRGDLAAEGLREGVLPNEELVLEQEAAVQDHMEDGGAGPSTQGNPGGFPSNEPHTLFESKLNALLAEVLPAAQCSF